MTVSNPVLVGIFVGGRSTRMGRPKGRVRDGSGVALLARLVAAVERTGFDVVLVGDATPYATEVPAVPRIPDAPGIEGPMAGLLALLEAAGPRQAIALACDMPFVDGATVEALASEPTEAVAIAARADREAPFEPFLARYDAPRLLPIVRESAARGERSLQRLLRSVGTETFVPADPRALADWDTPEDVERGGGSFDDGPTRP